ncbi:hypothetical protein B566_EDAN001446 [Ephemera danica]|nr:hypothetical protein B566_EDAN001446 [Ephemera danica]
MSIEAQANEKSGPKSKPFNAGVDRTRPLSLLDKKGTSGAPIDIQANYFQLCSVTDWCLYQYHVDFHPQEDRANVRKSLLKNHRNVLGGFLFDGMIMYTSYRLSDNPMVLMSRRQNDDQIVHINITFSRQLNFGEHEYMQFFNILMRKCLNSLKLQLVGRNFFDPHAKVTMSDHKMELWPGYVTSIRQHETDILLCTEITHKVMRQDTVLDLLLDVQRNSREDEDWTLKFKNLVLGLVVLTDYNNRTYRIDDVDFALTPMSSFVDKNNRRIVVAEYYQSRYQIKVRHLGQPLLVSRGKSREHCATQAEVALLVPELCRMTGLTDDMRSNFRLMSALAEHTRMGPNLRVKKLLAFSERLNSEPAVVEDLNMWNMQVSPSLVSFKARVLPQEAIKQGNGAIYSAGHNTDWTANLRANPMLSLVEVHEWVVMVPKSLYEPAAGFVTKVICAAKGMHMVMCEPLVVTIPDDRQATYINSLEQLLSKQHPQLVVCIASNNRGDRYGAIKKLCCVDRAVCDKLAVPTQVITSRCLNSKNASSIALKIAVQINCKLGGAPWSVEVPMKGCMVVGFDVTTDTMHKSTSFGALVATLDANLSKFFAAVSSHCSAEQLSDALSHNLLKSLFKYQKRNDGNLPSRIIVYRDGVGDGQIPYVQEQEVNLIRARLGEVYGESNYQLSVIVVSKRINTRFFTADGRNPPPGTVVDSCVTLPERFDFFVVSQNVRQGTVSPTSYNVIFDNSNLGPDKLQRLTYKLTHLYYNWSGTVRVPAPVQYAHKLATLTGQALHKVPNTGLEDVLFFLSAHT